MLAFAVAAMMSAVATVGVNGVPDHHKHHDDEPSGPKSKGFLAECFKPAGPHFENGTVPGADLWVIARPQEPPVR